MNVRGRTFVRRLLIMTVAVGALAAVQGAPALAGPLDCPRQPAPEIASCSLTLTGHQGSGTLVATATFTIAAGYQDVEVSLASYRKPPPPFAVTYPQTLYASATGFFDEGGPYTLQIPLPQPCGSFQVDLVRGPVLPSIPDADSGYRAQGRLLDAATGGAECPLTPGFWKTHASCSASTGNQDFVLDQVLLATGGILIGDLFVDTCLEAVRVLDYLRVNTGVSMSSNPFYKLARNLLAARLNLAGGSLPCAGVANAVNQGQALLDAVNYTGTNASFPTATAAQKATALSLATTLDNYNNGMFSTVCA